MQTQKFNFFFKVQNQILTCASSDVMHQWICLNELYKVSNRKLFSNFGFITEFLAEDQKKFKE